MRHATILQQSREDYHEQLILEKIKGRGHIRRFAKNADYDNATVADLWSAGKVGGTLLYPGFDIVAGTAAVCTLVSSDAKDTLAGVGARQVRVYGINAVSGEFDYEDVDMAGATPVNTVKTFIRQDRLKVLTVGSEGDPAGTITCKIGSVLMSQLEPGENQTQMAIQTLPVDIDGVLNKIWIGLRNSTAAATKVAAQLQVREGGLSNADAPFLNKRDFDLNSDAVNFISDENETLFIPAGSDVRIRLLSSDKAAASVVGGFNINWIDNA